MFSVSVMLVFLHTSSIAFLISFSAPELVSMRSEGKCCTHSWKIAFTLKQFSAFFPQAPQQLLPALSAAVKAFRAKWEANFLLDQHCRASLWEMTPMPFEMFLSSIEICWVGVPKLGSSDLKGTGFCSSVTGRVACSGYTGTGVCSDGCKGSGSTLCELLMSPKSFCTLLSHHCRAWNQQHIRASTPLKSSVRWSNFSKTSFISHHSLRSFGFLCLALVQLPVPLSLGCLLWKWFFFCEGRQICCCYLWLRHCRSSTLERKRT